MSEAINVCKCNVVLLLASVSSWPRFPFPSFFFLFSVLSFFLLSSLSTVSKSFYHLQCFSILVILFPNLSQCTPPVAITVFHALFSPALSGYLLYFWYFFPNQTFTLSWSILLLSALITPTIVITLLLFANLHFLLLLLCECHCL